MNKKEEDNLEELAIPGGFKVNFKHMKVHRSKDDDLGYEYSAQTIERCPDARRERPDYNLRFTNPSSF